MDSIGHVKNVKYFQGRGVFHHPHPKVFFWRGGAWIEASHDYNDFSPISVAGVIWRDDRRNKRRPHSGRNSIIHGRIYHLFRASAIIFKNSVFEHTPPLKNINIFDMSYWNSVLDSKIWASLTKNLLKTKNSVGGFSRKSKKDLSNNVSANFEKSPQRIFFVSIIWWSGRPKIWYLVYGFYRTCQKC